MGRHAEAPRSAFDLRRTVQLAGLVGGLAWVLALLLPDGGILEHACLWVGAVLLTGTLLGLGLLLVRSDVLALRLFVSLACPALVWGVFGLVHGAPSDPRLVDAVFGALVGLVCLAGLGHRRDGVARATL
jgi:hypothetical protein